jgi:hypothetical protein
MKSAFALALLCVTTVPSAQAGCQEQLRLLADDLKDVKLTESQKTNIASVILEAKQFCWVQKEQPAIAALARARVIAGIKPMSAEMDWETVPLESISPKN